MSVVHLRREDINNPIHPNLWESMCDDLGVTIPPRPGTSDEPVYPEAVTLSVIDAQAED